MRVAAILSAALCGWLSATSAHAQSMTPMRGEVRSVADAFAVRVFPTNPYNQPIRVDVRVYDQDFRPVENARVSASSLMLGSGASRPVIVTVPFDGRTERKVRVCTESIPFPSSAGQQIRAQICGRFLGRRLS